MFNAKSDSELSVLFMTSAAKIVNSPRRHDMIFNFSDL